MFEIIEQADAARRQLMLVVAGIIVACLLFGGGTLLGWYLHTPKVTQDDLNEEAKIADQYQKKRGDDKAKGDAQNSKAASGATKIIYRNCSLEPDDLQNLRDAFNGVAK